MGRKNRWVILTHSGGRFRGAGKTLGHSDEVIQPYLDGSKKPDRLFRWVTQMYRIALLSGLIAFFGFLSVFCFIFVVATASKKQKHTKTTK